VSQSSDERMAELRELFFESAQELLQLLNEEALRLEKAPGEVELVRSIRRIVHTLKGDSAACGYRELSELAHELEDALALESALANESLVEIALQAADIFTAMITAYHRNWAVPSGQTLREMIRRLAATPVAKKPARRKAGARAKAGESSPASSRSANAWNEYEQLAMQNALQAGKPVYHVIARIDPHCGMPIAGRQLLQVALAAMGEVLAARPEAGTPDSFKSVEFVLSTDKTKEEIAAKCQIPTVVSEVKIERFGAPATGKSSPTTSAKTDGDVESEAAPEIEETVPWAKLEEPEQDATAHIQPAATPAADNILRVDAERIDNVLNLVGELIIGKSMFQQALNEFGKRFPKEALRGKFADAIAFQARVLNDLQRSVMKIRMVPVEQLFRRFPRIVRDVARQCGKDVELVISGQDTDLDKSILDVIAEPLTHLVRNAVGHGIESAEERKRLGKTQQGTIRLDAYHQGNQVVVEVRDDGRGIDAEKIKIKAVDQGLITGEEAARLSEAEVLDFIFRPGFTTAEEITEVSGRGVGMDVVQSVMHRLKGTISVETRPGQGTSFRLKLPLTLAIIKAILFRVEQRLYAIPLNSVVEIARAVEAEIHQVDNYEVLQLRKQVLPLVRLGRPPACGPETGSRKLFVLVISAGEKKFGLIVDGLEGEEELVIKALDDHAISTDLVSGASILGDGRVVLILNLSAVVEHFTRARPGEMGTVASGLLLSHTDRLRTTGNSAVPA
jgi:two-component system, chemotaxis family, sensor kinase CheA